MAAKVLVACEESQTVCAAFRARGLEAYSCDIQRPSGGHPEWHILGDALEVVTATNVTTMDGYSHSIGQWDLLIAHPPCTYLSNVGASNLTRHGVIDQERLCKGFIAKKFFESLLYCNIPHIAVENPVPIKIFGLPPYSQIIEPYFFGHPYRKRTCLWLRNLPPLTPSDVVQPLGCWVQTKGSNYKKYKIRGHSSAKLRSKTFAGIAAAMAETWGDCLARECGTSLDCVRCKK